MSENTQEMQQVVTSKSTERKKKIPLFIGIAAVIVIGIVAVLSLTVFGGGSKTKKAMAQLDLGNKYLDELDFERAEAAFTAALQIDPKNADAYLGLIDLYAKTGDAEKLAKVYRDAKKEFTGSASTDKAELKKVKEKVAQAIEKLVREALADGDYEKAEKYAEYLAKVDSGKADTLKTQIAEAKAEAERKAAEEARIAAEKAEAERKAKEEAERKAKEEAERKAALAKELEGIGTGELITFGRYEQDNDTTNGAEPIDWVVLAKEADKMLVVSLYALDGQPYNTERKDVTWEVCTLRNWLNDSFYNAAFGEEEKAKIVTVTNENPDSNGFWNSDYGVKLGTSWGSSEEAVRRWGANGGNATSDNVFCLSYEEALAYFASDEARRCTPTAYAAARSAYVYNYDSTARCYWWLRSPGDYQHRAMIVYIDGPLKCLTVNYDHIVVRPALWISVN